MVALFNFLSSVDSKHRVKLSDEALRCLVNVLQEESDLKCESSLLVVYNILRYLHNSERQAVSKEL